MENTQQPQLGKTLKMQSFNILILTSLAFLWSCGQDHPEESEVQSQLGHTCYSYPVLKDNLKLNVCTQPGETFHGGLLGMTFAKSTAIANCKKVNALDYGHLAGRGKSCAKECESVVYCIPFTNK